MTASGVAGATVPFALSVLACAAVQAGILRVDDDGPATYQSIAPAVAAAQSGDTIIIGPGFYRGTGNRDIQITDKVLTIRGSDPNDPAVVAATVLDCQGSEANPRRAFQISPGEARLTLSGLTLVNGYSPLAGGAILCEGATLRVANCTFSNNRTPWWGGAVSCEDSDAVFAGCSFVQNVSVDHHGAALFTGQGLLDLTNCVFEENRGDAVKSYDSGVTVTECTFEQNAGLDGAAIHTYAKADAEAVAYLHIAGCRFIGNTAEASGGALYCRSTEMTVNACTFTSNAAGQDGGAIFNYRSDSVLQSCAFVGNAAAGLGGAVVNRFESSPGIINCTFVANYAAGGGAIANIRNSDALISHCILWNNTSAKGSGLYVARYEWGIVHPSMATVEFSDVMAGRAGIQVDPECTLTWAGGNFDADPLFTGPLQDDYHLSPDSPCIDTGDPNYMPEAQTRDLDDAARLFGRTVDIGAHEFQGLGPVYRFWSPTNNKHFYTVSGAERDLLLSEYAQVWTYEDIAYYAFYNPSDDLQPVHRFWSDSLVTHFWTIDEEEYEALLRDYGAIWTYEGIAFYAYRQNKDLSTLPVYRFWSNELGHHFYTMNEDEKDTLIAEYASVWTFEGVAWYAYPKPYLLKTETYAFTGGADEARYSVTLGAYVDGREAVLDVPTVDLTPLGTQMRMVVDFEELTTTLEALHVEAEVSERSGMIREASGGGGLRLPFTLSMRGSFHLPTPRGPYAVDPATGVFADFSKTNQTIIGKDSTVTYVGSVTLDGRTLNFNRTANITSFELEAFGKFEGFDLLPDALFARMPMTFQWHRQYVKDLLAETTINGRLIQLYVVYAYVGTQGLWQGEIVE